MDGQHKKDLEAIRNIVRGFISEHDCEFNNCAECQSDIAEPLADLLAAARKQALESDPVWRFFASPRHCWLSRIEDPDGSVEYCAAYKMPRDGDDSYAAIKSGPTPEAAATAALAAIGGDRE